MRQIKRAIHLDFHTLPGIYNFNKNFDAVEFAETLSRAKVDYINLVAKCNIGFAYYDTGIGIKYPGMKGDMFGEALRECHKRGIGVTAYFNVGLDHEQALRHREWCVVNREGQVIYGDKTANFFRCMCLNTGYKSYMLGMIRETVEKYEVDGVFLDCMEPFPCYGSECQDELLKLRKNNPEITEKQHTEQVFLDFCKQVKQIVGHDKYLFFNGCSILAQEYVTNFDIECLTSTSVWGYETFGPNVAYFRNKSDKVSFMTGRFQNNWGDFGGYKGKASLENDIWDAYCNGVSTVSIGDHMHPAGGLEPLVYSEIGEIYSQAEKLDEWIIDAKYLAEVGVLINIISFGKAYRGLCRMLSELKVGFEIIDGTMDFDRFKLLILPDEITVTEALGAKLAKYLEGGGKILSSGISGLKPDKSGFALKQWFEAMDYQGEDASNSSYFQATGELCGSVRDMRWAMYSHGILFSAKDKAQSLADYIKPYFNRHWDGKHGYFYTPPDKKTGQSAVTKNGNIIHICFNVFTAYFDNAMQAHKKLVGFCIDKLYSNPLLKNESLPSTARATLTCKNNTLNLHIKTSFPEGRGAKQIIEEHQVLPEGHTLKVRGSYSKVYCAPDREEVVFSEDKEGYTQIVLPKIIGYRLIALEKNVMQAAGDKR